MSPDSVSARARRVTPLPASEQRHIDTIQFCPLNLCRRFAPAAIYYKVFLVAVFDKLMGTLQFV